MEFGDETVVKLEHYLNNTLDDARRDSFEAEIAKSQHLQEFIAIYKQIDTLEDDQAWQLIAQSGARFKEVLRLYQSEETKAFSEKIKQFRSDDQRIDSKSSGLIKTALFALMAACMAFLIYVVIPKDADMAQLYIENSTWEELPSLVVKGDTDNPKLAVEQAFKAGNYQQSIDLSNRIIISSSVTQADMLLYKGVALLQLNQYEKSLAAFDELINSVHIDNHKGYWYKALVYLKQGDIENTKESLGLITTNYLNYRFTEAKELLEELD